MSDEQDFSYRIDAVFELKDRQVVALVGEITSGGVRNRMTARVLDHAEVVYTGPVQLDSICFSDGRVPLVLPKAPFGLVKEGMTLEAEPMEAPTA